MDTCINKIVTESTTERSLKYSPDWSGYAILQRRFCAQAIAFERKAGLKAFFSPLSSASKKNDLTKVLHFFIQTPIRFVSLSLLFRAVKGAVVWRGFGLRFCC